MATKKYISRLSPGTSHSRGTCRSSFFADNRRGITVLPHHIPLIASLKSGDIVAVNAGEYIPMAVVGGFVEIKPTENPEPSDAATQFAVLADFAEHVSELSDDAVEKAKAKAKAAELQELQKKGEIVDSDHFETELEKSLN